MPLSTDQTSASQHVGDVTAQQALLDRINEMTNQTQIERTHSPNELEVMALCNADRELHDQAMQTQISGFYTLELSEILINFHFPFPVPSFYSDCGFDTALDRFLEHAWGFLTGRHFQVLQNKYTSLENSEPDFIIYLRNKAHCLEALYHALKQCRQTGNEVHADIVIDELKTVINTHFNNRHHAYQLSPDATYSRPATWHDKRHYEPGETLFQYFMEKERHNYVLGRIIYPQYKALKRRYLDAYVFPDKQKASRDSIDQAIDAKYQVDRPTNTAHLLALINNFKCPTEFGSGFAGHFLDWTIHFSRLVQSIKSDQLLGLDAHSALSNDLLHAFTILARLMLALHNMVKEFHVKETGITATRLFADNYAGRTVESLQNKPAIDASYEAERFINTWEKAATDNKLPDFWYNFRKGRDSKANYDKGNEGTERRLGQFLKAQYQAPGASR
jgi:hypothetical protein